MTDSEGYTLLFRYDALNRITVIGYPNGTRRQFTWDRLDLVAITDRAGHTTTFEYNAGRRLTAVTGPLDQTTYYSYYPGGALKTLTDPKGNATTWVRDVQGRVIAKSYADNQGSAFTYDSSGRLAGKTDALGQTTVYHYTVDNKLAGVDYKDAVHPTPPVRFLYGSAFPRLAAMTDGHGTTRYSYYPMGVVGATRLKAIDGPRRHDRRHFTYDALGRLVSRTVAGRTATFSYDALGRVVGIQNALGRFAYSYLGDTPSRSGNRWPACPTGSSTAMPVTSMTSHLKAILNGLLQATERDEDEESDDEESDEGEAILQDALEPVASFQFTFSADGLITRRKVMGVPDPGGDLGGWALRQALRGGPPAGEEDIEIDWEYDGPYTDIFHYDSAHRLIAVNGRIHSQLSL